MVNATLNTTSTESVDADLERTLFNVRAVKNLIYPNYLDTFTSPLLF